MKKNLLRIICLISLFLIIKECICWIYINSKNNHEVNSYYSNNSSFNYKSSMVINIPVINLNTVVRLSDDNFNNLKYGLVYYKNSNYNEKIIIFGHSGMGYGTYFNRLDELKEEDLVYLYKDKLKVTYKVDKIYDVLDTEISILNNDEKRTLLLVTCQKKHKNRRLVIHLLLKSTQTLKK